MALQKQKVQLNIADGIDTKSDGPSVLATRFTEAENVNFAKLGGVQKRLGNAKLSNETVSGNTISSGTSLAKFNNQLIMTDNNSLYSYSPSAAKWDKKGNFRPFSSDYGIKYDADTSVVSVRHAVSNNLVGYVIIEDSSNATLTNTKLIIEDKNTETILFSTTLVTTLFPTIDGLGNISGTSNGFFITDNNYTYFFNSTTLTLTTTSSGVSSYPGSLINDGTNFYLAHIKSGNLTISKYDSSGSFLSSTNVSSGTPFSPSVVALSFENNGATIRLTGATNSTSGSSTSLFTLARLKSNLATVVHAPVSFDSSVYVQFITSIQHISTATTSVILYSTRDNNLKKAEVTSAGTVVSNTTIYTETNLVSEFLLYQNKHYVAVKPTLTYTAIPLPPLDRTSGSQQQTYGYTTYLLESSDDTNWTIVSARDKEETVPYSRKTTSSKKSEILLPSSLIIVDGKLSLVNIAFSSVPYYSITKPTEWTTTKVTQTTLQPSIYSDISKINIENQLLFNGALPLLYDGKLISEQGFIDRPQILNIQQTVSPIPGFVGIPVGIYRFYIVWSYRDNNGNVYRSAPSDNQYVQVTATNVNTIFVYVSRLNFTLKENVVPEIYMTSTNGITYHKLDSQFTVFNSISSYFSVSNLTTENTPDLVAGELLYTSGNALENDALNASYHLATHKNRVFSIDDNRQTLSYSQLLTQGNPIAFNGALKKDIPEAGGKLTGIGSLDNSLIIFKENFIYAMNGDGPNNLGQQDDFTTPQLITTDAGCIDKNSIINTPEGLLFNSAKGIYLLGRNFSIQYKGAPAEKYNTNVTTAVMLPKTNEIRFVMADSVIVNYDYFSNRWSTQPRWDQLTPPVAFDNIVDMIIGEDTELYHLTNTGKVYKYAKNRSLPVSFTDNNGGVYVPIKLTSSWISFAGLQGYQRLYKLMILATYKSPHKLKISFAYNMSETYVDSVIVDTTTVIDTNFYNLEIRPKRQKCSMVKFKIEELPPDVGTYGEGLTISGLAMELGVKEGLNKTVNTHGAT